MYDAVYLASGGVIRHYEEAGDMTDLRRESLVSILQQVEGERRSAMVRAIMGSLGGGEG